MDDLSRSVLVLGSTGFIGRHLVRELDRAGYRIFALARTETENSIGNVHKIRGSAEDVDLLRTLLDRCDHIVHAAGTTTPSVSAASPQLEIAGNLNMLARLLALSGELPGKRLIYLSSAGAVYGDCPPQAEEGATLRPRSYYGAGKAAAEAFIHACTVTTDWSGVVLRPSNVYGPGQVAGKGFAIVPTVLASAAEGAPFYVMGDGSTVRDYCFVSDLIGLIMKAIESPQNAPFAVYNAASGQTASVLQLISACERSSGRKIDISFRPGRRIDVPNVSLDTKSVRSSYGWTAKVPLDEGLDRTWRWLQESRCRDTHEE